ncbi:alpha/beta hydrolase [Rhodococcus sp. BP-149]|uniref:alpha/beta fold hydrolase n=1 Tax=unclassified Rhodococcus (in: high G+C Gram-positive bacteria) TaxID=192944 RepID=UPI001C9AF487|nr:MULTISPECIES: alpha/beta hydrolase [unclassified Rhodococcus (in: high G+C Gram-positive bacteria)]MBY6687814.1 alpha/beta hydrolase [Rhodococcus sp. BP-288]MBY6696079.1 alpha/beta hydrolase [Rhodococcus sp. BP-188]MBY6700676.1 alpha/beta hydrolase [Rhodococcus sp. BP-285]MBY6705073.1 alpha/beta hydrolase [Rhodococcus sp. BP-283]MBY6713801.1 alpha/beta hydrolase [Rhodococcus sp. BP-160]
MSEIEVNGGIVVYDFVGPEDGDVVVVTPGGRLGVDSAGVRQLALALADGGKRVLLWDRPNCGASDIQLFGRSESHMRADTLASMVKELVDGPVAVVGESSGAVDSIVFAVEYPHLVSTIALGSIVGGAFSTMSLAGAHSISALRTVRDAGVEGILQLDDGAGSWRDLVAADPRNRERLLALGAHEFEAVMTRWLDAYIPKPNEAVPGVADWEIEGIDTPTLIMCGGAADHDHPKRTAFAVHCLIRTSRLVEAPWADGARTRPSPDTGRGDSVVAPWSKAVPLLLHHLDAEPAGGSTALVL